MKKKTLLHNKGIAEHSYSETFKSIQLASLYVLYYEEEFDFSKQKIKNFNRILTRHNQEALDHEINADAIEWQLKKVGFDCEKAAKAFPYRAKMKMVGKVKPRDMDVAYRNINDALEVYFVLAAYTLRKNYNFSIAKLRIWLDKVQEFSRLYAEGMHDSHVIEYFKLECNLEISE